MKFKILGGAVKGYRLPIPYPGFDRSSDRKQRKSVNTQLAEAERSREAVRRLRVKHGNKRISSTVSTYSFLRGMYKPDGLTRTWQSRVVVGVAIVAEPQAQELLVNVLRLHTLSLPLFVRPGHLRHETVHLIVHARLDPIMHPNIWDTKGAL